MQLVMALGGHAGRDELSRKSRSVELNFTAYMAPVAGLHGCGRRTTGKAAKRCAQAEGGEVGPDLRDDFVDLAGMRHTNHSTHLRLPPWGRGARMLTPYREVEGGQPTAPPDPVVMAAPVARGGQIRRDPSSGSRFAVGEVATIARDGGTARRQPWREGGRGSVHHSAEGDRRP